MFKKYSSYLLLANMIYQYMNFFSWYLGSTQIQIESAFSLGMIAFISGLAFIIFAHISYFPRELNNSIRSLRAPLRGVGRGSEPFSLAPGRGARLGAPRAHDPKLRRQPCARSSRPAAFRLKSAEISVKSRQT